MPNKTPATGPLDGSPRVIVYPWTVPTPAEIEASLRDQQAALVVHGTSNRVQTNPPEPKKKQTKS